MLTSLNTLVSAERRGFESSGNLPLRSTRNVVEPDNYPFGYKVPSKG